MFLAFRTKSLNNLILVNNFNGLSVFTTGMSFSNVLVEITADNLFITWSRVQAEHCKYPCTGVYLTNILHLLIIWFQIIFCGFEEMQHILALGDKVWKLNETLKWMKNINENKVYGHNWINEGRVDCKRKIFNFKTIYIEIFKQVQNFTKCSLT